MCKSSLSLASRVTTILSIQPKQGRPRLPLIIEFDELIEHRRFSGFAINHALAVTFTTSPVMTKQIEVESPQDTPIKTTGRRKFLQALTATGIGTATFHRSLAAQVSKQGGLTSAMVADAAWIAGIELTEEEQEQVARAVDRQLSAAGLLRDVPVDADTPPALVFRPDFFYGGPHADSGQSQKQVVWTLDKSIQRLPDEELAFASILEQQSLLSRGKISSRELTQLYLHRLEKYDTLLRCVVTMLAEHALEQADASDARRRAGRTLGVLDGIPWVAKDLIAVPPWKTTWGAEPFQEQVRESEATVSKRLRSAGAVLLAKVSLGALAWGDKWFAGMTRNPWNPKQGSSGSSAGSAASVAAGLASFALGSETLGSIVSPCRRCRTSGLRPTFGRVSRAGCMPLAWSMDKIGPIARHVEDLALVFPELLGIDGQDPTLVERDYQWPLVQENARLRIGVPESAVGKLEQQALDYLESEGAQLVPLELESKFPTGAMSFILGTEATTVFDDAFRSEPQADYGLWANTFRQSQFVTAVPYLRANRLRGQMIEETEQKLQQVDVVLGADDLLLTNLTGHPSIVVACATDQPEQGDAKPNVLKLTAAAYQESKLLHVGRLLQRAFPPTPARPKLDEYLDQQEPAEQ